MTDSKSSDVGRDLILTVFPIKSKTEPPQKRCGHSFNIIGNTGYVYGGAANDMLLADLYTVDLTTFTWKPIDLDGFSVPGPLYGHSSVYYNGRIYMFGGLTQSHVFKFENSGPDHYGDNDQDSDDESKALQDAQRSSTDKLLLALGDGYSNGMSVRERLFFKSQGEECTNDLYVFDTATKQWAQPNYSGEPPCPRYFHSACVVKNIMILFGGCTKPGYKEAMNDIFFFNLDKMEWSKPKLSGASPAARYGQSMTAVDDFRVFVFGGACEDNLSSGLKVRRYNDTILLDLDLMEWALPTVHGSTPNPRAFHSACVVNTDVKSIWIFGGECNQSTTDVTLLDLDSMRWKRPLFDGSFEHEMQAAAEISGKLCVFGGLSYSAGLLGDFFFLNTVSVKGRTNELTFKIVLAGDSGVGKSGLMCRFVEDNFSLDHTTTVGLDFKTVNTMIEGKIVKLHVWDTAGQERFQSLTSNYYRGAHAAVIVYDITNQYSFDRVSTWVDAVDSANIASAEPIPKLLVGNKIDLVERRQVSTKAGNDLAKRINAVFVETSAKNSLNVDLAFLNLARKLVLGKTASAAKIPPTNAVVSSNEIHISRRASVGSQTTPTQCCS